MNLIEVLAMYRQLVGTHGRTIADVWLQDACEQSLRAHVMASVSDQGHFITADGTAFYL